MTDKTKKFEEMKAAACEAGISDPSPEETADLEALWAGLEAALHAPATQQARPSYNQVSIHDNATPVNAGRRLTLKSTPAWVWMSGLAAVLVFGVLSVQSLMVRATLDQMEIQLSQMRTSLILASLDSGSAAERLEGILQLSEGEFHDATIIRAVSSRMEFDPSTNVRLASVRTLSRYADEPGMLGILENAARNERSPLVALEILDLVRSRDPSRAEMLWQEISEDGRFSPVLDLDTGNGLSPSTTTL